MSQARIAAVVAMRRWPGFRHYRAGAPRVQMLFEQATPAFHARLVLSAGRGYSMQTWTSSRRMSALSERAAGGAARTLAATGLTAALGLSLALGAPAARAFRADDPAAQSQNSKTVLASLQAAFSSIADELEPAVVTVSSSKAERPEAAQDSPGPLQHGLTRPRPKTRMMGTGSGVIIRKDGWILTNDHVVSGADRVTVKLHDGREFVGTVRRDYRSDLALIKIESPTPLPAARLGNSDAVKIGHWAIAIGSPYRYDGSFSVGVISSLFRQQSISDPETHGPDRLYPTLIQTDAAINPGNSGGPLVNIDGEVIGINTAIESEGGGNIGIAFAIPIYAAKFVVDQLMTKGKVSYGLLGVTPKTVTPRQAQAFGVGEGAWIG